MRIRFGIYKLRGLLEAPRHDWGGSLLKIATSSNAPAAASSYAALWAMTMAWLVTW